MKKYLPATIFIFYCLLTACSKKEGGSGLGTPISDKEYAKVAFSKINALWLSKLKPDLTKQSQKYTDLILPGSLGGKAIVNGSYTKTQSSSSTSTRISTIADVTITFQQYETDGLKLHGMLRFYDSYNSRTACSSSGCASSTDTYISYESENAASVSFASLAIQFTYNDKPFGDSILLDADKQYSSWDVKLTNGNKTTFSFSY